MQLLIPLIRVDVDAQFDDLESGISESAALPNDQRIFKVVLGIAGLGSIFEAFRLTLLDMPRGETLCWGTLAKRKGEGI